MNILQELAEATEVRYQQREKDIPLENIKEQARVFSSPLEAFAFRKALQKKGLSLICEVKKASPSKGAIAEYFPYLEIAREYEEGGADAISVLTEPSRFLGCDEHLSTIATKVSVPVLRKDFTVKPYQLYEAKLLGASAILLICALLSDWQIANYLALCNELQLDALVEVHDQYEVKRALALGSSIIGVNNRNLKTFQVDIETSIRLRDLVPPSVVFISESGIRNKEDTAILRQHGVDAVLIGETLMRAKDKRALIQEFKG
ncbi:indole-3-glycerol phosphate synthase TrpC [uncultured Sphaerochaeta sp.]|uniref:indole-3-glycerol phosphate synthase TrpC n=1 Tax=uncultured Sphaerochaeta sp. TaxID=886478 RepID=UPI002A0A96E0|nr:indole-3-glycerol phosphate synthase TrpC [uncultured Sphaerochaeta sp.]